MKRIDKKGIADSFSLAAGTYDGHVPAQKYFAANLFQLISRFAPTPCERIADLGCGTGFLSEMIAAAFPQARLVCLDLAPGMIEQARTRPGLRAAEFLTGDIEQGGFGYNLDLAASSYVLQWTRLHLAMQSVYESLRPGGIFACALPVAGSFAELATAYETACARPLPGPDYPDAAQIVALAQEDGFAVLHEQTEDYRLFFPDAREALRSFKRCGAVFSQHEDYQALTVEEVRRLLDCYDTATREAKHRVGITFRTLYLVLRRSPS